MNNAFIEMFITELKTITKLYKKYNFSKKKEKFRTTIKRSEV